MWFRKELKTVQIESRISTVNQSIRQKAQQQKTIYQQFNNSKRSISELEEAVDNSITKYQEQTKQIREKVKRISMDMKEMYAGANQRNKRFKARLDQLKLRTQIQLIRQSHASQRELAQIREQFDQIQDLLKNNEGLKNPQLTNKLKGTNAQLSQKIPQIKAQIDDQRRKGETFLQQIANQLQRRIEQFKKKMIEHEHSNQEASKLLEQQILQEKNEIQEEIRTQRQTREQNKEKLLLLFETKVQKSMLLKK